VLDRHQRKRALKFSLRTILIAFLVIGLMLGLLVSNWKVQRLETELDAVKKTFGVYEKDHFELSTLGDIRQIPHGVSGSHLIRLANPQDYVLQASFYDGTTGKIRNELISPLDYEFAIWYVTAAQDGFFEILSARRPGQLTPRAEFEAGGTRRFSANPWGHSGPITAAPILRYYFYPDDDSEGPNASEDSDLTEQKLKTLCDKYKIKCVYFCLRRAKEVE
jgi:hypothetical protein